MHRTKPFPAEKACAAAYKVYSKSPQTPFSAYISEFVHWSFGKGSSNK
jgi:hypothetical protein